jgi:hypothetical protein
MRFFNKHSFNTTVQSNSKIIILLSTLVSVLLATPTAAARFKEYRQQWRFTRNTQPDWKVQYDTTTITASDANKDVVNLFQGHNSEGGGADIKTSQNNGTNIYWEIIVDNAGGRRNVSGVRGSEGGDGMEDTTTDQLQAGHVGLKIDVRGEDKEKRNKEQEPTRSRGIKEVLERFYEVAGYFTGLLDFEGNVLFVLLQSVFLFIRTLKNEAGNVRINVIFRRGL